VIENSGGIIGIGVENLKIDICTLLEMDEYSPAL